MKSFVYVFFALLLVSVTEKSNAQALDMNLTSAFITPAPALFPGTATITFNITAEILDQPLSSDDLSSSFSSISITLSDLQGSALILPTGAGADFYTWTYDAGTNSYTGFSKDATMTADVVYPITLSGLATTKITTTNTVGFLANLNPPGDLLASSFDDDAVSIFTRADLNLPVTLVSFDANKEGNAVTLTWATTEETNSDYFEVQHSGNGKDWNKIGMVKSHGESKVLRNYDFLHKAPVGGENLYRLKMVDNDQTFAYSHIKNVTMEGMMSGIYVYPNPVAEKMSISDYSNIARLSIVNVNGATVYQSNSIESEEIDVKNLSTGSYVVKVSMKTGLSSTHKIVIKK